MDLAQTIVLFSGPVGAGKTTAIKGLLSDFSADIQCVKTMRILQDRSPKTMAERRAMQELGERLDRQTDGKWVQEGIEKIIRSEDSKPILVVDSVRYPGQIEHVKQVYGRKVVHIHLAASDETLRKRYRERKRHDLIELSSYDEVVKNATEAKVPELERIADIVVDTDRCDESAVKVKIRAHLRLYGPSQSKCVDVLIGGQYGSEGKGQVAAYLASEYDVLIRVGGPNAGHTVHDYGSNYTFHSLPSGTMKNESAKIIIGPGAVFNTEQLMKEVSDCKVGVDRLLIDENAVPITSADIRREAALQKAIGSTKQGVGAAACRRIMERSKPGGTRRAKDVKELKPYVGSTYEALENHYLIGSRIFLEGTQGTGLSLYHGVYPYVTSRDTTVSGCLAEAGISPNRINKTIMVCRTYPIRVQSPEGGSSGPFMSRLTSWAAISRRSNIPASQLRKNERTSTTNRRRRVAEFDWQLLRKSASLNAPSDIALTFADYFDIRNRNAVRFDQLSQQTIRFIEEIEQVADAPVTLVSSRFHTRGVIDRRSW